LSNFQDGGGVEFRMLDTAEDIVGLFEVELFDGRSDGNLGGYRQEFFGIGAGNVGDAFYLLFEPEIFCVVEWGKLGLLPDGVY